MRRRDSLASGSLHSRGFWLSFAIGLWIATSRTAKISERARIDLERPWQFLDGWQSEGDENRGSKVSRALLDAVLTCHANMAVCKFAAVIFMRNQASNAPTWPRLFASADRTR